VQIGSDTQLVAPVVVGDDAYVGAGTTVTRDVPDGALVVSRVPQRLVPGWMERRRQRANGAAASAVATTPASAPHARKPPTPKRAARRTKARRRSGR